MKKKNEFKKYIPVFLAMGPMIWGFCLWNKLPHNMPLIFDEYGRVVFTIPKTIPILVMPTVFSMLTVAILHFYEKNKNNRRRSAVLEKIAWWGIPVFSQIFIPLTYYTALGYDIDIFKSVYVFWGMMFILIGNHLYKCRQNETTGIILPWTIQDPDNWNFTTHVAGVVFVLGGVFLVANALLESMVLTAFVIVAIVVTPSIFSYRFNKKKEESRK